MSLLCPKCMNTMRQYERNRVVVDQCTGCGGLFLDRGELEALVAAETAYYSPAAPAQPAPAAPGHEPRYEQPRYEQPRYEQPRYEQPGYGHGDRRYDDKYYKKKKRRSFLEDLFDD